MLSVLTIKRPCWFRAFGFLLLGFICWMIGNPNFKHESILKSCFNTAGLILMLFGNIGLFASAASLSRSWLPLKRLCGLVLIAVLLSLFSFMIFSLEYGVFKFGDSDLPPYQPDTPFERTFDFVWFVVTIGALVFWSGVFLYPVVLIFKYFSRHLANTR